MPEIGYPTGLVMSDDYQHAVRKKVLGREALCGAGRIVVVRPDWFDPHSLRSCPACRAAVTSSS